MTLIKPAISRWFEFLGPTGSYEGRTAAKNGEHKRRLATKKSQHV
jgi:hypothetical protein